MAYDGTILALDLARQTGWAFGRPGETPRCGSVALARPGASMAAHFVGCRDWLSSFLSVNPDIRLVVFEAPLPPSFLLGRTNANTFRILIGLATIIEEALDRRGYDVREARVSDVRAHFLGTSRLKRADAKAATKARCAALGWKVSDDNAADAAALWSYMVSIMAPELAVKPTPLLGGAR